MNKEDKIGQKEQKLTAKQASFIEYYCNPKSETYNNAVQSAVKAGYSKRTINSNVHQIMSNNVVGAAMADYAAKNVEKIEYNYTKAMSELDDLIATLSVDVAKGNMAARTLLLAAIREKNEISGLHKQRFVDESEQLKELSDAELLEAKRLAMIRLKTG